MATFFRNQEQNDTSGDEAKFWHFLLHGPKIFLQKE